LKRQAVPTRTLRPLRREDLLCRSSSLAIRTRRPETRPACVYSWFLTPFRTTAPFCWAKIEKLRSIRDRDLEECCSMRNVVGWWNNKETKGLNCNACNIIMHAK
jgi:hypothetical protein